GSYNDAASFDDISVQPYLPEQPVGGLWVDSTAAGAGLWSLRDNLQQGDVTYADRNYTFISVPAGLQGAQWIRPAADSKTYTGSTLAWFGLLRDADVYVAIDERTSPPPAWLDGWTATGDTLTVDFPPDPAQTIVLDVYRRRFAAGFGTLGNNGMTNQPTYVSIVVPLAWWRASCLPPLQRQQETGHQRRDLGQLFLEREVAGLEQVELRGGDVAQVGARARRG